MTDDEAADQLHAAAEAIRATVARLLHTGELHPQLIVMAVARVAGSA